MNHKVGNTVGRIRQRPSVTAVFHCFKEIEQIRVHRKSRGGNSKLRAIRRRLDAFQRSPWN